MSYLQQKNKQLFLIGVLQDIHNTIDADDTKESLKCYLDTVYHSAPEIIDERWTGLYNICRKYINDMENPTHVECFKIYNKGYKEYCMKFNDPPVQDS